MTADKAQQREATIQASEEGIQEDESAHQERHGFRKEGDEAVQPQTGQDATVGREGGHATHIETEGGANVPRKPHG